MHQVLVHHVEQQGEKLKVRYIGTYPKSAVAKFKPRIAICVPHLEKEGDKEVHICKENEPVCEVVSPHLLLPETDFDVKLGKILEPIAIPPEPPDIKLCLSVFIMDNYKDHIPEYLDFVEDVMDREDLPLNISRETLQLKEILKMIKKNLMKKNKEIIEEITEEEKTAAIYGVHVSLGTSGGSGHSTGNHLPPNIKLSDVRNVTKLYEIVNTRTNNYQKAYVHNSCHDKEIVTISSCRDNWCERRPSGSCWSWY